MVDNTNLLGVFRYSWVLIGLTALFTNTSICGALKYRSVSWSTAMREEVEKDGAPPNQSASGKTEAANATGRGEAEVSLKQV